MRIAFYAPLKAPNHEVPSGDRSMAELLISALAAAGYEVDLVSRFRSYDGAGERARQRALATQGGAEAARIAAAYLTEPSARRPGAWFTYHLYHKAPDWLGPVVSDGLGIPYLIAEAAYAPKQAGGPWAPGHAAVGRAIAQAKAVLCLSAEDREQVAPLLAPGARLELLPPFLDGGPFARAARRRASARAALAAATGLDAGKCWLLSVAMMREGDKLASYRQLGTALELVAGNDWQLVVVGDGPARREVEAALAPLGASRLAFIGRRPREALPEIYAACDVYVWPAVGEAYGMALLEAQAAGLPVVAGRVRGVPEVVRDGTTGLLTDEGNVAALAAAVRSLLDDEPLRVRLGRQAGAFVAAERTIGHAARVLDRTLRWAAGTEATAAAAR